MKRLIMSDSLYKSWINNKPHWTDVFTSDHVFLKANEIKTIWT